MYLWVERDNFSMSITMISVNGSSHDPRGMPPFKTSHDDRLFAIFTLCCRFVRKDANHLTTKPGIASSIRLLMTTVLYDLRGQTLLRIQQTWHWQVETGQGLCATLCNISTRRELWTDLWWLQIAKGWASSGGASFSFSIIHTRVVFCTDTKFDT